MYTGQWLHNASLVAQAIKNLPAMQETQVPSLGRGRSPGEGKGYSLQYSPLENPVDRGAWWVIVHEVAKSQTWLSDYHTGSQMLSCILGHISKAGFPLNTSIKIIHTFKWSSPTNTHTQWLFAERKTNTEEQECLSDNFASFISLYTLWISHICISQNAKILQYMQIKQCDISY